MAYWKREDNWLAGIAAADHSNHVITGNLGDLTVEKVQAAFDVTYGRGRFNVRDHGQVITVFSIQPLVNKMRRTATRMRERGDVKAAAEIQAKLAKYEGDME